MLLSQICPMQTGVQGAGAQLNSQYAPQCIPLPQVRTAPPPPYSDTALVPLPGGSATGAEGHVGFAHRANPICG